MSEAKKPDNLEEQLKTIIKQKTDENKVLKKLLERLENGNQSEKSNSKKENNIKNKS